jgi:hypothetical protein
MPNTIENKVIGNETHQQNTKSQSPNLLIVLPSRLYIRNFLNSGALDSLASQYSCSVALREDMDSTLLKSDLPLAGFITLSPKRIKLSTFRMYLTMWAHRQRSTSYALKFNIDIGFRKLRYLYELLALPGLLQITLFVIQQLLGRNRSVDAILDNCHPAMVLIASNGTDLAAQDTLASCKRFGIPSFMLINGWDNLSTKGTMAQHPDILGVWGDEACEHAQRIQHVDPSRIRVLGVPHFEMYRAAVAPERITHIRTIHTIPSDSKIIIFAGCSRDVAELALLDELERNIAQGSWAGIRIIYRPHPWSHATLEANFHRRNYSFITLDVQIREGYERAARLKLGRGPEHFSPELDYYPALISSAYAVISPLSTFLIEAALMGKPALAIAFSMGKTEFPLEQIYQCEHFHYLRDTQAILTTHSAQTFIGDVQRLLDLAERPSTQEQLRKDIAPIVLRDATPYADRLLDQVQKSLAQVSGGG